MPWLKLKDGTDFHVTMAKRGMVPTEKDIEFFIAIVEAAKRQMDKVKPTAETSEKYE